MYRGKAWQVPGATADSTRQMRYDALKQARGGGAACADGRRSLVEVLRAAILLDETCEGERWQVCVYSSSPDCHQTRTLQRDASTPSLRDSHRSVIAIPHDCLCNALSIQQRPQLVLLLPPIQSLLSRATANQRTIE